MIKISIIIPIYNMEKYLEACLASVLSQTLPEKEIICVNDGSNDGSLLLLRKYESQYQDFVVLDQKNQGAAVARNQALAMARGEFIAFMDADDFYPEDDCLEYLYQQAIRQQVSICGGSMSRFNNSTGAIVKAEWPELIFDRNERIQYRNYQYHYGYSRFIYRKDMLEKAEINFPEYIRYQDPPFFVKAMTYAGEFYAVSKSVYCYRLGYKKIQFTRRDVRITRDILCGIRDILLFSKLECLAKLHETILYELHCQHFARTQVYLSMGEKDIEKLAGEINEAIDLKLLAENEANSSFPNCFLNIERMKAFSYEPAKVRLAEKLTRYDKIIIYGAGNYGKRIMEYLTQEMGIAIMAFAVTVRKEKDTGYQGIDVKGIEELAAYRGDALVISGVSVLLRNQIRNKLQSLNFQHILTREDENDLWTLIILKEIGEEEENDQ